ncbi:MAG: 2-dehydro-3-deoxyphosphogluconate aldolase, partial [Ardenticatenaceae bacterium]|nr:2-dehydro-3-deoxyphosphogluconate aldolase [Ardenticatenaceae bacterium]
TLKAIAAPYGSVKFVPTGGISAANLADYLRLTAVHACGGSWMVAKALIAAGDFAQITRLSREAVAIVQTVREQSEDKA